MIPFARMLGYGNELPTPIKIKRIYPGFLGVYVLYTDGQLWGIGANYNGELGPGTYTGWVLMGTDIEECWTCENQGTSGIVMLRDGQYYYRGIRAVLGQSGTPHNDWYNIGIVGVVQSINLSNNSIHYIQDGKLYSRGVARKLGTGSSVNSSVFVESTLFNELGLVKKICTNSSCLYVQMENDLFYAVGLNSSNQLQSGSNVSVLSPIQMVSYEVQDIGAGNNNNVHIQKSTGSLYGRGRNNLNSMMSGSTSDKIDMTYLGISAPDGKLFCSNNRSGVYTPGTNTFRVIGNSINSFFGSGSSSTSWVIISNFPGAWAIETYKVSYSGATFGDYLTYSSSSFSNYITQLPEQYYTIIPFREDI